VWVQGGGPALLHDGQTYAEVGAFVVGGAGGSLQGREMVLDGDDLYVAGGVRNRVAVFDARSGEYRGDLFAPGSGGVDVCWGLAVREEDVLVASAGTDEVLRYDRDTGAFLGALVSAGSGGLDEPYDVAVNELGTVFVSSRSTGVIFRYTSSGAFVDAFATVSGTGLRGLGFDHRGNVLACTWDGHAGSGVYRFDGVTGEDYGLVARAIGPMFVALQAPATTCRADLDCSGDLDLFDFLAFQRLFEAGDAAADFDGSGALDVFDFLAFQNVFDAGCS
jgi:hypothetical protein